MITPLCGSHPCTVFCPMAGKGCFRITGNFSQVYLFDKIAVLSEK
ncbi:hypothetical protein L1281_001012 [Neisseria sp. HSC-16F19]|nr:hypothetical protein [Neisseria sp. HSC-16F19]MCP2040429.1 hypothetical protein [Neisseria sp. HSC-16F19]